MGIAGLIKRIFQGISGSFAANFIKKAFVRLRMAVINPFRKIIRSVQRMYNANLVTAKLTAPIAKKIRGIFGTEAKSPEDYITIGNFWISRFLVYFIILAACAAVFIYFTLISPLNTTAPTTTENVVTSVYFDYDDMDLAEFDGKANIYAENGKVVYTGSISKGVCSGTGTVWNQDGNLVYQGELYDNKYKGAGIYYYANGKVMYQGSFSENTFQGEGRLYFPDGTLQYEGDFEKGAFSGKGVLYDEKGNLIYEGSFLAGYYHGSGTTYYSGGSKKYVGEFYQGKMQGIGTLYAATGRVLFTGNFVRDGIQYESLVGKPVEEVIAAIDETPIVYYSQSKCCYLFQNAGIVVMTDAQVKMLRRTVDEDNNIVWYLENDDGTTLASTKDVTEDPEANTGTASEISGQISSGWDVKNNTSEELAEQIAELPSQNTYSPWFYVESSDEWISQEQMKTIRESNKTSGIMVTAVGIAKSDYDISFLRDVEYEPRNGAVELMQSTIIDQLRSKKPTVFSSITFNLTYHNNYYIYVDSMNLADSVYEEIYELEGVRYHLYYEKDDPDHLMFVTFETVL